MDPAIENTDLGPPPAPPILRRGLPVAIVAHVLLGVALAFGLQWKRQPDPAAAAVPLPPVTAAAPSTATMGAGPAPSQPPAAVQQQPLQQQPPPSRVAAPVSQAPAPAPAARAPAPASPPTQVVARNTARPAPPPAAGERVSPSFDCDKARSVPERIICADPDLSRQDRELGRLYARAREASPNPGAFRRHSDARWADRERQCRDRECLQRWYAQRREELSAALGEAPPNR
ncbi:hypothetical protein EZ313_10590 [Ramlibacter henchirensis]|uniref:DUF1311 domain-containing protein n=1 Tax=Ramlibacter henchirensis TaxID=204072 RepID=A0A4Z0C5J7_9BURK|nr:hypothetical protein [Ramlibacter henchirensis]TFZ07037.1 hypothetical protein EZ313_10590 [Ramlibacter henchirensis]